MNILIGVQDQQIKKEDFLKQLYLTCQDPQVSSVNIVIDCQKNELQCKMELLTLVYTFAGKFSSGYHQTTNVFFKDQMSSQNFVKSYSNKLARKIQYEQQIDLDIERETINLQGEADLNKIKQFLLDFKNQDNNYDYKINQYQVGALGGTFNFMHNGHKLLLSLASLVCSQKLIVGATSDEMVESKDNQYFIESCKTRQQNVLDFLNIFDEKLQKETIELKDSLGGWDLDYEVLIVSEETQKAVEAFNNKRKQEGKSEIQGCVLKLMKQNDVKFSSTQMRQYLYDKLDDPETKVVLHDAMNQHMGQNEESLYLVENLLYKLLFFYSQQHRVYHTTEHLFHVLDGMDKVQELNEEHMPIIIMSLLFHDIIIHPLYKNNEKLSADFFEVNATQLNSIDEKTIKRIGDIIRSTETHDYSKDDNLQNIVSDLDMSVLQLNPKKYERYVKAIKMEYSMVENFEQKRAAFLKSVLEKDQGPFFTKYFSNEKARENMQKELDSYN